MRRYTPAWWTIAALAVLGSPVAALAQAVANATIHGIVADATGAVIPNAQIKARQTVECVIIGYTRGKGDRAGSFGALHLARGNADDLKYVGKVGAGFDEESVQAVADELKKLKTIQRPIEEKPLDDARSVWVESKLICEVQFASVTPDGMLREPVFVRLRPDLTL